MGNQPTKHRAGCKTMVISHLQKSSRDVRTNDSGIRRFVSEMKAGREELDESNETKFFQRFNLGENSRRASENADKLLNVTFCLLCNQTIKEYEEAPCRICWRVYHEQCIRQHPDVHNADRIALFKAKSNIGWSCYKCSDLSKLLTTAERTNLLEQFKKCDINKDKVVTFDEYLKFKYRMADEQGEELYPEDDKVFRMIFKRMDLDGDGTLDGWEFINHEAKMILAKRDKRRLVSYLTEKEIQRARLLYDSQNAGAKGHQDDLATLVKLKSMIGKKAKMIHSQRKTASEAAGVIEDDDVEEKEEEEEEKKEMNEKEEEYNEEDEGEAKMDSKEQKWQLYLRQEAWAILASRPNMHHQAAN